MGDRSRGPVPKEPTVHPRSTISGYGVLDIQKCLIEGAYPRGTKKRDQLSAANRKIEVLRWLVRMALERELLTHRHNLKNTTA